MTSSDFDLDLSSSDSEGPSGDDNLSSHSYDSSCKDSSGNLLSDDHSRKSSLNDLEVSSADSCDWSPSDSHSSHSSLINSSGDLLSHESSSEFDDSSGVSSSSDLDSS